MVLIAFLACHGKNNDKKKMERALKREFNILLKIKGDTCIFYNNSLFINGELFEDFSTSRRGTSRSGESSSPRRETLFKNYCKVFKIISEIYSSEKEVDILFSSHNNRRLTKNITFSVHDGNVEIPMRCLLSEVRVRNFYFNCCNGNQIDLNEIDFSSALLSTDYIGYTGIVDSSFSEEYPSINKIFKHLKSKRGGKGWALLKK